VTVEQLQKVRLILLIIAALLGIWEAAARITGTDGPIGIAKDIGNNSTTTAPNPSTITTTGKHLDKPAGVSLSGDCQSGFTLTWQPVDGADTYRIERDGVYNGTERDTDHSIPAFPDGNQHRFRVFAEAFPRSRSEGSDEVVAEACSF
jgi:hypothetical protein